MKPTDKTFRFKLTDHMCDNISYVIVGPNGVRHCGKDETPFALSNIVDNAVEFRALLEDIYASGGARVKFRLHREIKKKVKYQKTIEAL